MNTLTRALAALAIGATITGGAGVACSSSPPAPAEPATSAPSGVDAQPAAAPAGPQAVTVGQRFDILDSSGTKMADAAFTKIAVDIDCSESRKYSSKESTPTRGHFLAVTMDIATTPQYAAQSMGYPSEFDFALTGSDGYAETSLDASSANCVPFDDTFNAPLAPSTKYKRTVLLDAKSAAGTLAYKPHFDQGWAGVTVPVR